MSMSQLINLRWRLPETMPLIETPEFHQMSQRTWKISAPGSTNRGSLPERRLETKLYLTLDSSFKNRSVPCGEPVEVIKGCLNIANTIATVVGGPYGAAAVALCSIFGSVLSLSTPSQPDLATVFIELQKFNQKLHSRPLKSCVVWNVVWKTWIPT